MKDQNIFWNRNIFNLFLGGSQIWYMIRAIQIQIEKIIIGIQKHAVEKDGFINGQKISKKSDWLESRSTYNTQPDLKKNSIFTKKYHWSDTIESEWTLKYYVLNLTVKKILAKNFCWVHHHHQSSGICLCSIQCSPHK